jgi:glycosyltransferase involved in cell wall biosynthesis
VAVSERATELSAAAASPARATGPRVAVDVHMIGSRESGNETYMAQLAPALSRLGGYDYLFYTDNPAALPAELATGGTIRPFERVPFLLRKPVLYPRLLREDHAALVHVTGVAPLHSPCPTVVAVHDVSYLLFPRLYARKHRLLSGVLARHSARRAACVITISECSRRDITRFFGIPPERIVVTPLAAGSQYRPQPREAIERVRATYDLPDRYVLAVGTLQPRKNLLRLVEAFRNVASAVPDVQLALVGRSLWRGSEVERAVARAGLEGRVRFTGYVPDTDLPALYAGAAAFCYPSLYEGFGMPPLEAMACETPVVTSNTSSLPEVVGDAAITVDPTSIGEIATGLRALLTSDALSREYRHRGLAQARRFSWDRTAQLTREVYDAVLGVRREDHTGAAHAVGVS